MAEVKMTKEELIAKAEKPAKDAMKLHPFYRGKIEVVPKCCIRDIDDFAIWYTPGVAAPCKAIHKDPEEVLNACRGLGAAMDGIEMSTLSESERLANRGW